MDLEHTNAGTYTEVTDGKLLSDFYAATHIKYKGNLYPVVGLDEHSDLGLCVDTVENVDGLGTRMPVWDLYENGGELVIIPQMVVMTYDLYHKAIGQE